MLRLLKVVIGGALVFGVLADAGDARAASASGQTVQQLASDCGSKDQSEELLCMTYFMGFVDGLEAAASLYGANVPICYPESGLSISDWMLTFRLWASIHPEDAKDAAPAGVLMAMVERFPCKTKP